MKKRNYLFLFLAITALLIQSCAIEKRMHRPGYSITKNTKISSKSEPKEDLALNNVSLNEKQEDSEKDSKENSAKTTANSQKEIAKKTAKQEDKKHQPKKTKTQGEDLATTSSERKSESTIMSSLNSSNDVRTTKQESYKELNTSKQESSNFKDEIMTIIVLLLCIFIPPVGVYIVTRELKVTLLNLLLTILFVLPGIIHALYIFFKRY